LLRRPPSLPRHVAAAVLALALAACGVADVRSPGRDASPLVALLATPGGAGAERLRAGDLQAARATFEAELDTDPDRLGALNDLAVTYVLEGHADAARRLLDEVVSNGAARDQQAGLVNLGELYAAEGYLSAAKAYLETARGIDPARPEPWYALALLADSRGDLQGARAALREALRLDDGAARSAFAFVYVEERMHLDAMVAEQVGDRSAARTGWRALAGGRFPALSAAAERHLAGD
jgi:Tfp pilus assembly protein PilF